MAGYLNTDIKKVTANKFVAMKRQGEKISMLTAYDFTTATIIDSAGIDGILVGDSASNVMAGNADTLPITLDVWRALCNAHWLFATCRLVLIRFLKKWL